MHKVKVDLHPYITISSLLQKSTYLFVMASSPAAATHLHPLLLLGAILFLSTSPVHLVFCANPDSVPAAVSVSQFVAAHNAARRLVGVPPLVWDKKLASFARAYAQQRRGDCDLVHSPGYAYGENIFWGKGKRWAATDVVAAWVAEKRWYSYDTNTCTGPDCTHYTQIVWRTTQKVGCSKIICHSGDTWVACEYYPPGNYIGARPYIIPKH